MWNYHYQVSNYGNFWFSISNISNISDTEPDRPATFPFWDYTYRMKTLCSEAFHDFISILLEIIRK